jgi:succinoglycan biosynthesis protein ExoO
MTSHPRFSVVMPLFNKASHVAAALDSVFAQTHAPHEIIVIDNGSTDGGREIVAQLPDPRIILLDLPTPGPGGYAGRNVGIRAATGNWIAFLDADDLWTPHHLADIAQAIADDPSAGAVAKRFDHVFADRTQPQRIAPALHAPVTLDFAAFLESWLAVRECPMWTGAIAIRRAVLIDAGLFPEGKGVRGGDKELWLRIVRKAPLRYIPRPSATFHRDSENKVSKSTTTLDLPMLVATARAMMASANPHEVSLLRRLVNQEIAHYARYSMKYPGRTAIRPRDVYLPEGLQTIALVMLARLLPGGLRQHGHKLRNRVLARA